MRRAGTCVFPGEAEIADSRLVSVVGVDCAADDTAAAGIGLERWSVPGLQVVRGEVDSAIGEHNPHAVGVAGDKCHVHNVASEGHLRRDFREVYPTVGTAEESAALRDIDHSLSRNGAIGIECDAEGSVLIVGKTDAYHAGRRIADLPCCSTILRAGEEFVFEGVDGHRIGGIDCDSLAIAIYSDVPIERGIASAMAPGTGPAFRRM